MYQVIVKNVVSREILEVIVKADCAQTIYDKFGEAKTPDDQWNILFCKSIGQVDTLSELSSADQLSFFDLSKE